jgi:hypothetical protein
LILLSVFFVYLSYEKTLIMEEIKINMRFLKKDGSLKKEKTKVKFIDELLEFIEKKGFLVGGKIK